MKAVSLALACALCFAVPWDLVEQEMDHLSGPSHARGQPPNANHLGSHIALLKMITDPGDQYLKAHQPIRLAKIGPHLQEGAYQPYGDLDDLVLNYTAVKGANTSMMHHMFRYDAATPGPDSALTYLEVLSNHPKGRYFAFVFLLVSDYFTGDLVQDVFPGTRASRSGRVALRDFDGHLLQQLMLSIRVQQFEACADEFARIQWPEDGRELDGSDTNTYRDELLYNCGGFAFPPLSPRTVFTCANGLQVKMIFTAFEQGRNGTDRAIIPTRQTVTAAHSKLAGSLSRNPEVVMWKTRHTVDVFMWACMSIWAFLAVVCMLMHESRVSRMCYTALLLTFALGLVVQQLTIRSLLTRGTWSLSNSALSNVASPVPNDSNEFPLDTAAGAASRQRQHSAACAYAAWRVTQAVVCCWCAHATWAGRFFLLSIWALFGITLVGELTIVPVAFGRVNWISCISPALGVLFPMIVWFRLHHLKRVMDGEIAEDMVQWRAVEHQVLQHPDAQHYLGVLVEQSKQVQQTSVPRQHFGSSEEPSLDALYFEAKTLVPYLSRLLQVCVLLLRNVFSYYRMCSLTTECVLLLP